MAKSTTQSLTAKQTTELLDLLQGRFEKNKVRHKNISWNDVAARLQAQPQSMWRLQQMESTGGEPDVISMDVKTGAYLFMDCAAETPAGRRSTCFDREGLDSRKEHKPAHNAIDMAAEMGVEILNEEQYRYLQTLGAFDTKTSSWIQTPSDIRKLGGALFADRRYGHVFVYHNGAQSYYGSRGFRGLLRV